MKKSLKDSIAKIANTKPDKPKKNSFNKSRFTSKFTKAGNFQNAVNGTEQLVYAENESIKVAFTNKGGQPKWIQLKNFKNQDSSLVKLAGSDFDKISYTINTGAIITAQTGDLFFNKIDSVKNPDGSKTVSFTLRSADSTAASITHQFILKRDDYMVDFNVLLNGADKLLTQGILNLNWQYSAAQQESSISFEKQNTQIGYVNDSEV